MSFDALQFLESVNPDPQDGQGRTVAEVLARAAAAERQGEAAERDDGDAKRAAAEERYEALALTNRALGDPLAEVSRAQVTAAQAREDIADLEAKLARARGKLGQAEDNLKFFAERMQAASDCAQRSASTDLLAPAKEALAAIRADAAGQRVDAMLARAPRSERRPFASRGSVAARSEQCVHCINQGVDAETSFLLHNDPERNVPVTTAAEAAEAEQTEAGRYTAPRRGGMAVR